MANRVTLILHRISFRLFCVNTVDSDLSSSILRVQKYVILSLVHLIISLGLYPFVPTDQYIYLCKQCRSRDRLIRLYALFTILSLIYDWNSRNPYLQQRMCPNSEVEESVSETRRWEGLGRWWSDSRTMCGLDLLFAWYHSYISFDTTSYVIP